MAQSKKILISLSDSLLQEMDSIINTDKINRSELIRRAMKFYIKEYRKQKIIEDLENGYREMAGINLELSEFGLEADNQALSYYEEILSEREIK